MTVNSDRELIDNLTRTDWAFKEFLYDALYKNTLIPKNLRYVVELAGECNLTLENMRMLSDMGINITLHTCKRLYISQKYECVSEIIHSLKFIENTFNVHTISGVNSERGLLQQ